MVLVQLVHPHRADEAPRPGELLDLARDTSVDARQRLLLGVVALCDARPPAGELSPVLGEIFLTLARQAEREVRKVLAERLAHADWAPAALVNVLALDEIEIARPILASSPLLREDDLLRVLIEASLEHQIAVARRSGISGRVADAVIERAEPAVLMALATNRTAEISVDGLRRLVEHSRRVAALRGPLTRHPLLTEALAEQLYQWVGTALRQSIAARFTIDERALGGAVYDAVEGVLRPTTPEDVALGHPDRDEMERRLIDKLRSAGQLRAGFLIRAVRDKRLGLFAHGLATLGGFGVGEIRQALEAPTPEALYYACAAVGIDRAVFPTLLTELRKLNRGLPGDQGEAVWLRGALSSGSAARAFRALIGGEQGKLQAAV
ncbi:MAG: DUF2336 domain-containing protein [Brevundimonas sp.]|uniref:DUF2336 domain-containing protein n=1 Tax=Brevundimonas sp. TaxID=1871086 RepID=UPI002736C377|nr:DUF2336 domain-containing protein [Brevundimonas sp.]MDP3656591.1 DUF2336 domain-containing protein [Brevundimonas sp.]MDZ4110525.1 DUF2336 domain-containing protein [Brevundimonas sp.]